MINYWIRYFVYAIGLLSFAIFGSTNSLIVAATLFLIAEINYLFDIKIKGEIKNK